MTSFAFVLGVLPLAFATGAGAGARNSVGTSVAGGMLASTGLSIFFIPVLYVVIRTWAPGKLRRRTDDDAPAKATALVAHE
jgi:multidrug efflux pump subunit AcrB